MPMVFKKNQAFFRDVVGGEDAETLLEWLHTHPKGTVHLAACTHLHTANLQVLMAARPKIVARPTDASLAAWLDAAMSQS